MNVGVYKLFDALKLSEGELDLVEISSKAVPPVCKILNYKKVLYMSKEEKKFKVKIKSCSKRDTFWASNR